MLSKSAATTSISHLTIAAANMVKANFNAPNASASDVTVTGDYSSARGPNLTLNGSGVFTTNFLSMLGYKNLLFKALAISTRGMFLRLALVLDNTGLISQDNKTRALQTSVHDLLTRLQNAATPAVDVYVSIIPFNKDVNIGTSNIGTSNCDQS